MVKQTTITLPKDLARKAKKFADKTGRTFSGLVRISLKDKMKENERK